MVKDSLTDFLSTITFTSVWATYSCRPKHSGCRDAEWPVRRELGWEKSLQQHLNWNQLEDTAREQLDGAVHRQVKRQLGHTHFVNHNNPVSNCRSNAVLIEGGKNKTTKKKAAIPKLNKECVPIQQHEMTLICFTGGAIWRTALLSLEMLRC